jgi:hypothetical protein
MFRKKVTDRALHIELLRTRAALERTAINGDWRQMREALTWRGLFGGASARGSGTLLATGADFLARYPHVLSTLSSLLMSRRARLLRLAGLSLAAWLSYRASTKARDNGDQHPR